MNSDCKAGRIRNERFVVFVYLNNYSEQTEADMALLSTLCADYSVYVTTVGKEP